MAGRADLSPYVPIPCVRIRGLLGPRSFLKMAAPWIFPIVLSRVPCNTDDLPRDVSRRLAQAHHTLVL